MGNAGPPRKTAAQLKQVGASRAKDRARKEPPILPVDIKNLEPPEDMRKDAIPIWNKLVPLLDRMGVLSESDIFAIVIYCETYAKWREAEAFILANGEAYDVTTREGEQTWRKYPQASAAKEYADQLVRQGGRLGLSPSDRAALVTGDSKLKDLNASKSQFFDNPVKPNLRIVEN